MASTAASVCGRIAGVRTADAAATAASASAGWVVRSAVASAAAKPAAAASRASAGAIWTGAGIGSGTIGASSSSSDVPGASARQERRAAGLRLDLDDGLLEEAGHAALEALAAADHYGVGAELLAHLREGVGQAAGAEGLGGGGGVHREGSLLGSRDTTGEQ